MSRSPHAPICGHAAPSPNQPPAKASVLAEGGAVVAEAPTTVVAGLLDAGAGVAAVVAVVAVAADVAVASLDAAAAGSVATVAAAIESSPGRSWPPASADV